MGVEHAGPAGDFGRMDTRSSAKNQLTFIPQQRFRHRLHHAISDSTTTPVASETRYVAKNLNFVVLRQTAEGQ